MHMPASMVRMRNRIARGLYRISKDNNAMDIKKEWLFLNDQRDEILVDATEEDLYLDEKNRSIVLSDSAIGMKNQTFK